MKHISAVLKGILFLVLGAAVMSFVMESVVVNTFSQEILSKKVSGYVLDKVFQDVGIDELAEIEDTVRSSRSVRKITSKFIDTVIGNVLHNEDAPMDIEREVNSLLNQSMPAGTSAEKREEARRYVTEHIADIQERLQLTLLYSFGEDYAILLRAYSIFTGAGFRILMCLLSIASILALIHLEGEKSLKTLRNISFLLATFSLIVLGVIKLSANAIDQRLAGGWLQGINVSALILAVAVECVIGIFLLLAGFLMAKRKSGDFS